MNEKIVKKKQLIPNRHLFDIQIVLCFFSLNETVSMYASC